MNKSKKIFSCFNLLIVIFSLIYYTPIAASSNKVTKRQMVSFGPILGIGNIPSTTVSTGLGIGMTSLLRLEANFGSTFSLDRGSYALGVRFFVPPWNFSPTLGVFLSEIRTPTGSDDFPVHLHHVFYAGGFDWQIKNWFSISFGLNFSPKLPDKYKYGPYFYLTFMVPEYKMHIFKYIPIANLISL